MFSVEGFEGCFLFLAEIEISHVHSMMSFMAVMPVDTIMFGFGRYLRMHRSDRKNDGECGYDYFFH